MYISLLYTVLAMPLAVCSEGCDVVYCIKPHFKRYSMANYSNYGFNGNRVEWQVHKL